MIHLKNSISHLGLTCIRQIHFEWWSQKLYNTRSYLCLPHSSESAKIQPQLAVTGRADESKTLLQKVYWSTNHKPSNLAVVNHCLLWKRWLSWRFRLKRAIVLSDIHFTASVHVINLNTLSLYPSCPFNKVSMCVHACVSVVWPMPLFGGHTSYLGKTGATGDKIYVPSLENTDHRFSHLD